MVDELCCSHRQEPLRDAEDVLHNEGQDLLTPPLGKKVTAQSLMSDQVCCCMFGLCLWLNRLENHLLPPISHCRSPIVCMPKVPKLDGLSIVTFIASARECGQRCADRRTAAFNLYETVGCWCAQDASHGANDQKLSRRHFDRGAQATAEPLLPIHDDAHRRGPLRAQLLPVCRALLYKELMVKAQVKVKGCSLRVSYCTGGTGTSRTAIASASTGVRRSAATCPTPPARSVSGRRCAARPPRRHTSCPTREPTSVYFSSSWRSHRREK